MDPDLQWIADALGAASAERVERVQDLWRGYGEIVRVRLASGPRRHVIVKWVRPPPLAKRGSGDERLSDARKRRSYEVEHAFYRTYAPRCSGSCRVPALLASRQIEDQRWLVLEDLDEAGFSERRHHHDDATVDACLGWLAAFHATFLGTEPTELWPIGTYWHLDTRRNEARTIEDPSLREAAAVFDAKLEGARYRTLVHGDAKLANFCFGKRERAAGAPAVTAVDFQYVGGGCAMKDVAYLLSGHWGERSHEVEQQHLNRYFAHFRDALEHTNPIASQDAGWAAVADAVEREWRALYPIACADFYRFMAGWAKEHWASDRYGQRLVRQVIASL